MRKLIVMFLLLGSVGVPGVGFGMQTLNNCISAPGDVMPLPFLPTFHRKKLQLYADAWEVLPILVHDNYTAYSPQKIYLFCKGYRQEGSSNDTYPLIPGYAVAFNGSRGIPDWTSYSLTQEKASREIPLITRLNDFHMDEELSTTGAMQAGAIVTYAANCNKAYDPANPPVPQSFNRGHLMPAQDAFAST